MELPYFCLETFEEPLCTSQVFIFTTSEKLSYIDLLSKKSTYKLERIGGNGYKIYTTQQTNHPVSRYDTQEETRKNLL